MEQNLIRVSSLGFKTEESPKFVIDRPWGLGFFLLLRFHSPMTVLTAQGQSLVETGRCLLYSPGHPQYYRSQRGSWVNDWMHLEGEAIEGLAAHHQIPMNEVLHPSDTRFFARFWEEIRAERWRDEADSPEAIDLLVRQLLLQLGRSIRDPMGRLTPAEAAHLPRLRVLREQLHDDLAHSWTVGEMAASVGLSSPRFAALYQQFFGVSPGEDLLRARLGHAQYLLTNRAMTVREAATQCGFRSFHYFSHVFHQRVGCPPSAYYRRAKPGK